LPSLARNSLARFAADAAGLVLGMACGIITARWLGPAGKGLLSAIIFLSGFCIQLALIGLGESAIVAIGQKKATAQEALATSIALFVPATLAAIFIFWAASRFEFRDDWSGARIAVAVAVIAAFLAEQSGSTSGLGHLLTQAAPALETARAYASAVVMAGFAIALFYALGLLERRFR